MRNDFNELRANPDFISVGDDLVFSRIDKNTGFQIIETSVLIPNNRSSMNLSGLFLRRNFGGSSGTWSLEKQSSLPWLTNNLTALRIGRLEVETNQDDDRTALLIDPTSLNVGVFTGEAQPPFRFTVFEPETYPNLSHEGAVSAFKNSVIIGGSAVYGAVNNTGDNVSNITYASGELGGYSNVVSKNVGVQGHGTGEGAGGIGVFGSVANVNDESATINSPTAWGALGYDDAPNFYAVYANGDQFSTTGSLWSTSDRRLKQNIEKLAGALDIVKKLEPKTFRYRQEERFKSLSTPTSMQYGFIAQEVEAIIPQLVREVQLLLNAPNEGDIRQEKPARTESFKALQNIGFIPILTAAIKELDEKLQSEVRHLERENQELKDRVTKLEAAVEKLLQAGESENQPIELSSARLEQNVPNPSQGITQISFETPEGTSRAELRITDTAGKLIRQISIAQSGPGQVELNTRQLSAGSYFYTLYLDGKLFETKQMVISR